MFTSGLLLLLLFAMWVCLHVAERKLFAGLGILLLLGCYAVNSLPAALVSAVCLAVGVCTRRHGALFFAGSLALLGAVNLKVRVEQVPMYGDRGTIPQVRNTSRPLAEKVAKEYPAINLAERLKAVKPLEVATTRPTRFLAADVDQQGEYEAGDYERNRILHNAHSLAVKEFLDAPGFGYSRVPVVIEQLNESDLKRLNELSQRISMGKDLVETLEPPEESMQSETGKAHHAQPVPEPSRAELSAMQNELVKSFGSQAGYRNDFSPEGKFSYVGFSKHAVRKFPRIGAPATVSSSSSVTKNPWKLRSIELLGMVEHEGPVVYLNESLPDLHDKTNVKTRKLEPWEELGVQALLAGETVVSESYNDKLYVLGAIRNGTSCQQCHDQPRGALLGAFSYRFGIGTSLAGK